MLIKCPECCKEISDKASNCIHCGFPLTQEVESNLCIINSKKYDLSDILSVIVNDHNKTEVLINIRQKCDLQIKDAVNLYNIILQEHKIPKEYNCQIDLVQQDNKPKCPICNSTNLSKISTMSKASSVALFGIFAMGKVSKQWKCNSCKSEF